MILSFGRVKSRFLKILDDVLNDVLSGALLGSVKPLKKCLGPNNTMDQLLRFLPYGADWEGLIFFPLDTLVARSGSLDYADASHIIAIGACIHKRQP